MSIDKNSVKTRLPNVIIAVLLILTAVLSTMATAEDSHVISMMTDWKVKRSADKEKLSEQFFRLDFDDSAWEKAVIKDGNAPYTDRIIFYRRWVNVPAAWKGKKTEIRFGGVDDDCVVYINGRKIGEHQGWNEEFKFDVTSIVHYGARNLVALLCDNSGGGPGGIWHSVQIGLPEEIAKAKVAQEAALRANLKRYAYKIVYETYRKNNWELFIMNADGSNPTNLTKTPDVDEMYPHVSPDGTKICFVADEGKGKSKVRNVYYMNIDGTGRTLVAKNARQQCWSPDGTAIAYLKGEFNRYTYRDFATKGIFIYDLKTGKHREHPNKKLYHLYNICWSPDGNWFVATVHGGMGYRHTILAIEANGMGVFNLSIPGCRPDISPDGKKIAWGASDWELSVADLDLTSPRPRVTNRHAVVRSSKPMKIYHIDWSPDGKYVAFSRGPSKKRLGFAPEIVGIKAKGWNICVADASATNRWVTVTSDGMCNKEPDWVAGTVKFGMKKLTAGNLYCIWAHSDAESVDKK